MPSRTITVEATGRIESLPELAVVEATAIGDGPTPAAARDAARDRTANIRDTLSAVAPEKIRTVNLQIEDATEMFDPPSDAPYRAKERVEIACVPEIVEEVVLAVTNASGSVNHVRFELHEAEREALADEALSAAMRRAREKAEKLAQVERLEVGTVQEITTKEPSSGMESIVDDALSSCPDSDIQPSPITIAKRVEVVYELVES